MPGTPGRKFGRYRVYQPRRGSHPHWDVYDDATGEWVAGSEVKASADFAAQRLAEGVPLQTPQELMDRAVALYASTFQSRFAYHGHRYLVCSRWMAGGLCNEDVTDLTPEGQAWRRAKEATDTAKMRAEWAARGEPFVIDLEDAAVIAAYRAGAWPDVGSATGSELDAHLRQRRAEAGVPENCLPYFTDDLDDEKPHAALGKLAAGLVDPPATPEWVEDARAATILLLRYGVEDPRYPDRHPKTLLARWAAQLADRYGGVWTPEAP